MLPCAVAVGLARCVLQSHTPDCSILAIIGCNDRVMSKHVTAVRVTCPDVLHLCHA